MKIQILINNNSWAMNYKKDLKKSLSKYSNKIIILSNHKKLNSGFDVNIIFSYFRVIEKKYLNRSKFNLIPHESDLPKGRGMSPLSWQILRNKNNITFTLLEASQKMDAGKVYFKKKVSIKKDTLFNEIKHIQYQENLSLLNKFLTFLKKNKVPPKSKVQKGKPTYYKQRKKKDSKLDISKSIKSQFNLMRISDFNNYPNFFFLNNNKYLLKITKEKK